ncbi:spermidine/putrescine ABC transporter permease PotB [Candidatus Pantoea edessiphila]|uniref:Spermidine/putrescine ABC transporter permease PotB n=1 Tax=Candidatus Pantoea edessiphila TaxID=2044610 RepID=A0A2P5SWX1_9GAMM|nr:spermidine/putrescine ABC transporter permease PotB [Candidatus Pantoea edessiphila]PPI86829.1 spermidine/putrescine ABC transporter permease PotB [Candidatus Pantoea edessiphila]
MKLTSNRFQKTVILLIVGWLITFVFLPNLMIFIVSFLTRDNEHLINTTFTFDNYIRLIDPLYIKVLLHSLNIAIIATVFCLLLGYPFAWCLTKLPIHIKPIMLFLLIVPFWTNSLVRIYCLKIFLSTRGWFNNFLMWLGIINKPFHIMYKPEAVIFGLIYILLPFMILPIYSNLEKLDKSCLEAAYDLGANKIQTFFYIILPLTMPGIIAGCLLVLIPAMGMFYVSDLMGGAKNLLIGNIIKNQFLTIRDWPFGASISIVVTFLMWIMLLIYWRTMSLLKN